MEDSGPTTQTEVQTVIQSCVELVKQYTQLTVVHDVEEVYMVMRIMKRMGGKSSLWKAVEDLAVPSIQVIVGACYGGVFANYWKSVYYIWTAQNTTPSLAKYVGGYDNPHDMYNIAPIMRYTN